MNNPVSKLLLGLSRRVKMNVKYFLLTGGLTLLLVTVARAWYKCGQLKFCEKLRRRTPSQFMLKLSSKLSCSLIGKLVNKETEKHFDFFLTALAGGKFSIYINDPIYPRRQVNDSLTEMPAETSMRVNVHLLDVGEEVFVEFEDIRIVLFTDPFNLTAYRDGKEVVKVNSLQLLKVGEIDQDTAIALDFVFPQALRSYGLPEHAERLSLRTTTSNGSEPYRLYNTDRFGYSVHSTDGLYGSVPVLYCPGTNITAGVFWYNAAQTYVDIRNNGSGGIESYFMSKSGALEAFVLTGPTLKDCVKQYSNLTGVAPLPQMFALGYHQSRYSYMSQEEVLEVSKKFEEIEFPLDVIWMDIDYTDGKKYFTWNPKTFSNSNLMLNSLNNQGRKAVAVIDPHIKREIGYSVFDECEAKGYFVKNPDNTSFSASCWPGLSSWIDFLNPEALSYYSSLISEFSQNKNLHIWNDMNEPSVFKAEEQTMNGSCVHHEGWQHQDVHNQYGFYQTIGTYDGLMERGEYQLRPFVLTRSFFAGSQRYAAHWTGDNVASWEHLKISVPMILTEALAGISFVGADVGGFTGNPSEELLQRWYQAGAWYPFFRAHSDVNADRREPYLFNEEVQTRLKDTLRQRYRHLPYWYTLFWEHYRTGEPVIRPLSYHYTNDTQVLDVDSEFLVGAHILVHPVCEEKAKHVHVYLPGGDGELWYNKDDLNSTYKGTGYQNLSVTLDTIPVFYKGGSIIPVQDTFRSSTVHMKDDPITLLVFLDKTNLANGTFYDDDQVSFDYVEDKYTYVNFNFSNSTLSNHIVDKNARYNRPKMLSSVILYGLTIDVSEVYIGKNKTTRSSEGISVSIDFQNMYTCGVKKNNKTVILHNLDLDVRDEFIIKFKENSYKSDH